MTFGDALESLKLGMKVSRVWWPNEYDFIFLVPGSTFKTNHPPLLGIYPEGTQVNYRSHIDICTNKGIVPWVCTQDDLLADDWRIEDSTDTAAACVLPMWD